MSPRQPHLLELLVGVTQHLVRPFRNRTAVLLQGTEESLRVLFGQIALDETVLFYDSVEDLPVVLFVELAVVLAGLTGSTTVEALT